MTKQFQFSRPVVVSGSVQKPNLSDIKSTPVSSGENSMSFNLHVHCTCMHVHLCMQCSCQNGLLYLLQILRRFFFFASTKLDIHIHVHVSMRLSEFHISEDFPLT